MDDAVLESSEFFSIALSSSDSDVVIFDGVATVVIIDDDGVLKLMDIRFCQTMFLCLQRLR